MSLQVSRCLAVGCVTGCLALHIQKNLRLCMWVGGLGTWGKTLVPKVGTPGGAETGAKSVPESGAAEFTKVIYRLK